MAGEAGGRRVAVAAGGVHERLCAASPALQSCIPSHACAFPLDFTLRRKLRQQYVDLGYAEANEEDARRLTGNHTSIRPDF